jgi:hypothetical protein
MKRNLMLLALAGAVITVPSANAAICSDANNCTFTFDVHNSGSTGFGSGTFGTLNLVLSGGAINATIDLADGYRLISTGFPGAFGFNDTIGGGITVTNFSSPLYSLYEGNTTGGDEHFNGFGFFDDVAATTAPGANDVNAVNVLSFTINRTSGSFTSIQQLVALSDLPAGDGRVYFTADVFKFAGCTDQACTGLIGVSGNTPSVPEPVTSGLVGTGLISLFFLRRRFVSKA